MVVGITGGIGSGKTTIVKMFAKFENIAVYYADDEAKKLMNTSLVIKEKLIEVFSEDVFLEGKLNKVFLAGIVFKDKGKLKKLNDIVHPVVHQHLRDFIKENNDKEYIVYENAILFENGSESLCDKVITITAPINLRIGRVVSRDKATKEQVVSRMKSQWLDEKKIMQSHYVINNLEFKDNEIKVLKIHKKLTKSSFLF